MSKLQNDVIFPASLPGSGMSADDARLVVRTSDEVRDDCTETYRPFTPNHNNNHMTSISNLTTIITSVYILGINLFGGISRVGLCLLLAACVIGVSVTGGMSSAMELSAATFASATISPRRRTTVAKNKRQSTKADPCVNNEGALVIPKLTRLSSVKEKPVEWLWENKFPCGSLSLITGIGGVGKSYLTIHLTAHVTSGKKWADGSPCEKGSVLFFHGEDGLQDTYKARCRANGVKQSHVVFMEGAKMFDKGKAGADAGVTLADVAVIEMAMQQTAKLTGLPCRTVIIDPISNFWGKTNENSNASVRAVLKPLQELAEKSGAAFVLIQHTGKSNKPHAQQKVLGSTGITAICRTVWGVYADPNDTDTNRRLFVPLKVNCGSNHTALAYRITEEGKVAVLETDMQMTGDDVEALIAAARKEPRGRKPVARNEVTEWLRDFLAKEGKPVKDIQKAAEAKGFSLRTLERAKKELGIKPTKNGSYGWVWCILCSSK